LALSKDKSAVNKNYDALVGIVKGNLKENPDYANDLLVSSLNSLDDKEISSISYLELFVKVRNKAESKPELIDHLGPNAKAYLEEKFIDKYTGIIEDSFDNMISSATEKSPVLIDFMSRTRNSIVKRITGEK